MTGKGSEGRGERREGEKKNVPYNGKEGHQWEGKWGACGGGGGRFQTFDSLFFPTFFFFFCPFFLFFFLFCSPLLLLAGNQDGSGLFQTLPWAGCDASADGGSLPTGCLAAIFGNGGGQPMPPDPDTREQARTQTSSIADRSIYLIYISKRRSRSRRDIPRRPFIKTFPPFHVCMYVWRISTTAVSGSLPVCGEQGTHTLSLSYLPSYPPILSSP